MPPAPFVLVGSAVVLMACSERAIETCKHADEPVGRTITVQWRLQPRTKVDLLFLIDNSNSMEAMQEQLRNRLPALFQPFTALAAQGLHADLHIATVTSDFG